jgi:hypothetical protein
LSQFELLLIKVNKHNIDEKGEEKRELKLSQFELLLIKVDKHNIDEKGEERT